MNSSHHDHGIQHAAAHGDPHGHDHAIPLPFTDAEWEEFQKSDIQAGKMIIALLAGIFVIGLVLYSIIAGITTFDYGPLA
jgi:hypothetical protein